MKPMKRLLGAALTAALLASGSGGSASAQTPADQMTGRHSVEGQVTRVDAKKGWVHVKTSDGTMIVHFPPADLQTMKKGDRITVNLALKDNGPAPK
jgi:hypothetical protein